MADATGPAVPVIDADTHVCEPPDLWTSRLGPRHRDRAPLVDHDPAIGELRWRVGGKWLSPVAYYAMAGWTAPVPSHPASLEEADPGAWQPEARLARMDADGITAQVLYPNVIAFNAGVFMKLGELGVECTRAYNDFITEFAAADPERLLPMTVLPFWDLDAALAEITRCHEAGHRGILFAGKMERVGLPHFTAAHWDPLYALAQDLEQSINFHAGFSADKDLEADGLLMSSSRGREIKGGRARTLGTALGHLPPVAETISNIVTTGLCDRFPRLQFVSVESGFGYIPYLMESLDWHWRNYGCPADHPTSLLPSEYFKRQVHATFWYERDTLRLLDLYADSAMFETDYPHPTGLSPGPFSAAEAPQDHIAHAFADVDETVKRKALFENAAKLYRVSLPVASRAPVA